jgi:hypothetical protein
VYESSLSTLMKQNTIDNKTVNVPAIVSISAINAGIVSLCFSLILKGLCLLFVSLVCFYIAYYRHKQTVSIFRCGWVSVDALKIKKVLVYVRDMCVICALAYLIVLLTSLCRVRSCRLS